eukprot:1141403-Pelagomonas_calceolata.AAC.1
MPMLFRGTSCKVVQCISLHSMSCHSLGNRVVRRELDETAFRNFQGLQVDGLQPECNRQRASRAPYLVCACQLVVSEVVAVGPPVAPVS